MALPDWDGKTTLRQLTAQVDLLTGDLQRIAHELGIGAKPYSGHEAMEKDILPTIQRWKRDRDLTATALYDAKVEEGRLQAQIRTMGAAIDRVETGQDVLRAMIERATMALRAFSEADDEAMSPDSVRAEARRTLREMRKIGGVN